MLRVLVVLFVLLYEVYPAYATVLEFKGNGQVEVYEAEDYLSRARQQKFVSSKKKSSLMYDGKYDAYIKASAERFGVDENLIHAVIRAESSYNAEAVSPVGAEGLMQLMPATAQAYGVDNSFLAEDNIDGGTRYLKALLDRYQGDVDLSVAAYNAGEGAVDKYHGIPPYDETIRYVARVNEYFEEGADK